MGHNILTTGLQLVRAFSVFANGGYLVTPTLLENGEIKKEKVLPAEVANAVLRAIRFTTKPGGTARRADIPGYTVAGKTSTPKKNREWLLLGKALCSLFCRLCSCK